MSRRFSSKARKAAARSAPRPREPLHNGEPVGYFAKVAVQQYAIEVPQVKVGAQALTHNDGVTVRLCAIEVPQMNNGAQALTHNAKMTVRQCAIEAPQVKNSAQALPHNARESERHDWQNHHLKHLQGTFLDSQRTGTELLFPGSGLGAKGPFPSLRE